MNTTVSIDHPTDRPNFSRVSIGSLTLWFSYNTCIAVWGPAGSAVIENYWGPTTGKHLNYVSTRERRVNVDEFQRVLDANLAAMGLASV